MVAAPREQSNRDALIDDVVFGHQDVDEPRRRGAGRRFRVHRLGRRSWRAIERPANRLEELGRLDRLGQISRDAERLAPRDIACKPGRAEHHDRRPCQLGTLQHLRGDLEAVQVRHVRVEQHQPERLSVSRRRRERLDRRTPAVDERRPHTPARGLRLEDAAIQRVVVDDQHAQIGEARPIA